MELLEAQLKPPPQAPPGTSVVEIDERAARRSLRDQIAKLERELATAFVSAYPRQGFDWTVSGLSGPRMLSLGELERIRDGLSDRLGSVRADFEERAAREEENRRLIERMMLDPGSYKYVRVSREDIGERGCGHWHVRPRLGIIGMMMGWWQVKLSSGCPLARGLRPPPPPLLEIPWAAEVVSARLPARPPARPRSLPVRRGPHVRPGGDAGSVRRRPGVAFRSSSCASCSPW